MLSKPGIFSSLHGLSKETAIPGELTNHLESARASILLACTPTVGVLREPGIFDYSGPAYRFVAASCQFAVFRQVGTACHYFLVQNCLLGQRPPMPSFLICSGSRLRRSRCRGHRQSRIRRIQCSGQRPAILYRIGVGTPRIERAKADFLQRGAKYWPE